MRLARLPIFFASLCLLFGVVSTQAATIAVAANMKDAFTEIANVFKANINAAPMKIVYGSSGNFAAQIQNGAPFNLFIAADERFPLELYKSGKTIDDGSVYAIGKLAVLFKASSEETLLDNKASIGHAISRANKIAIAKPDLSPYGKATVAYLRARSR
jgi:molybdate transport system substrate-binding protein